MTVLAGSALVVGQWGYRFGRQRPAPCQPTLVKRAPLPAKLFYVVTETRLKRLPENSAGTCTVTNDNGKSVKLLLSLLLMSCLSLAMKISQVHSSHTRTNLHILSTSSVPVIKKNKISKDL